MAGVIDKFHRLIVAMDTLPSLQLHQANHPEFNHQHNINMGISATLLHCYYQGVKFSAGTSNTKVFRDISSTSKCQLY